MSSEDRAPSAVRNLRSLFENKHADSPPSTTEPRGRSPSGLSAKSNDRDLSGLRRTSKVRASFVSVEPSPNMATLQPSESGAERRGSFGEADKDLDLVKSISQEPAGPETAVSSAVATPNMKPVDVRPEEKQAENPDKPMMGEQEEPREMKPADLSSAEAVSGGQALPPVAEDLRKSTNQKSDGAKIAGKKPLSNGTSKPAAISTKAPSKPAASSVKSPSAVKTPTSSTSASKPAKTESPKAQPAKAPLKKVSRSSLAAPTAASMARSGSGDKSSGTTASKPKPREPTKPVSLPSHLTMPTASSRAKHEAESQPKSTSSSLRSSTTTKPKPSTTAAKPSRSSLAPEHRPGSRASQASHTKRTTAPADGSFLERMMKPTAASASKTHEKTELKSPPRQKAAAPPKPKANGTAAKGGEKKKEAMRTSDESSTAAPMPSEVPIEEPREGNRAEPAQADAGQASETIAEATAADTTPATIEDTPQEPLAVFEPEKTDTPAATNGVRETSSTNNETPQTTTGNETPQAAGETATSMEATPAGMIGTDEAIR